MNAEIITIGDEILIGQIVDTNSAWLGQRLGELGIRVFRITSVSDSADEIASAIDCAMNRSQLVLVTGGLGPTKDDITKHTLAKLFESHLVENADVLEDVRNCLERRGIEVTALNRAQAQVPECARVVRNHNGTAPGMWFERNGSVLLSLPGVPYEMKSIMEQYGFGLISEHFALKPNAHVTMLTFGIAESILADQISAWENALPSSVKLAYLPNPQGVKLRLSCYDGAYSTDELRLMFDEVKKIIGGAFVGEMPTSVESEVARMLNERKATLSVAESCTGGYVSSKFTAMSGASVYYKGAIVSYGNRAKKELLGVSQKTLDKFGAVSCETAEEMADGARAALKSDYAISITGIAGPDGGSAEKPVGTVCMAIATPYGIYSRRMQFGNLRDINIQRSGANAINMLRLFLLGQLNE
jgi:nicotinamide-nucleotide amidase